MRVQPTGLFLGAFQRLLLSFVIVFGVVFLADRGSCATPLVIDSFSYSNSPAARASWQAIAGSPPVEMADSGEWGVERVMTLPCNFSTQPSRCYWDRAVSLNLSAFRSVAVEMYVQDPGAISSFTLYFHSGSGWFAQSVNVAQSGWQTFVLPLADFSQEGVPAGWDQVDIIRISLWREGARDNFVAVRELRASVPDICIIRDTESSNPGTVEQTVSLHVDWLSRFNVSTSVVPNSQVQSNYLAGSSMVILPYNENLSDPMLQELERFAAAGGKLMTYYLLPARLQNLLGVRITGWTQGDFAAYTFSDTNFIGVPARVKQSSWNIMIAEPSGAFNSRVIATWQNSAGATTGRPAWLASDRGLFMSHILLGDDKEIKPSMLLALVGHYVPGVWSNAAQAEISNIGRVADYASYEAAVSDIRTRSDLTFRFSHVEAQLDSAALSRSNALASFDSGNYPEAIHLAQAAHSSLRSAYSLCQAPATPEFRAVWEHSGTGPFPGNWPAGIDLLASNGFNAVFPNMLWGGLAHYNSTNLPHSSVFVTYGDQVSACVAAAHSRGIQVHVWKVNWNLAGAPQSFVDSMRAAARTQVSSTGQGTDWLCPSHPDNFAIERDSMLEVARNYDIDGLHFDYIRYPDHNYCYCSGCRDRFTNATGLTVTNWPADVLSSGALRDAFLNWRREQITRLVQSVSAGVRALKPGVRISAAVFGDRASAYDEVGQDWEKWIALGIVDFLCPMDYTTSVSDFRSLATQQVGTANGRVPIYPGIGAYLLTSDNVICEIGVTRELQTGGFILFNYDSDLGSSCLPALAAGVTADDEPDTDRDHIADTWEMRWFGSLAHSGADTDSDGDHQADRAEFVAGTDPTDSANSFCAKMLFVNGTLCFSFTGRAAEGLGYGKVNRHYRIEATPSLFGTVWAPLAGFSDRVVASETEELTCPISTVSAQAMFYRARVWLEQKP